MMGKKKVNTNTLLFIISIVLVSITSSFAQITCMWNGSADHDWNNSLNWTLGTVPGSTDNVIISPSGGAFDPVITGTVTVNNITILNGASVTISMGAELIVNDVTGPGAIINQGRLAIQGNNLHTHPDPYGGTVSYTSGGAQLIRYHKYQNIELQNGLKNITGDILLTGNFYCYTSCNVINSDVTIAGNYYNNGLLIASGTSTFKFNNNTTDQIIGGNGIHIFQNLEISKSPGGRLILQDSIQINGQLIWTGDGVLALSSNNLVIGPLATFVNTGTYGPTRMIETDGLDNTSGMIIRKGLNPIDFNNLTIPIGSNGKYTPVWLKRIRIAGPTNIDSIIALKVVQDNVCNNCVRRFLRMQASDMMIDSVDFRLYYPKSEKVGYPSKVFRVVSGIPNPVSGVIFDTTSNPSYYGANGENPLSGDWKFLLSGPHIISLHPAVTFCKGSSMKIIGTSFWGVTQVTLNGYTMHTGFTYVPGGSIDTIIVHSIPTGVNAGIGTVTVTTPGGTSNAVSVTIADPPTVNAGPDVNICAGDIVSLSANISGPYGTLTVQWTTSGSGAFSNSSSLNTFYTPSAADIASGNLLIGINVNVHECGTFHDDLVVVIQPQPTINAHNPSNICGLTPVSLNGTFSGSASVQWSVVSGNGVFSAMFSINTVYTPAPTDIGNLVILRVTNVGTGVCPPRADTVYFNVYPVPTASHVGDTAVCSGSATNITLIGADQYSWVSSVYSGSIHGNTISSTSSTINDVLTGSGGVQYDITPISLVGCQGPVHKIRVKVSLPPSNTATVSDREDTLCYNEVKLLTIKMTDEQTQYQAFTLHGEVSSAVTSNATGSSVFLTIPYHSTHLQTGINEVTIKATKPGSGCPAVTLLDTVYLTKSGLTTTSITSSMGNFLCATTTPLVLSVPFNTNNSYQWFLDGIKIIGAANATYSPVNIGQYTVKISDTLECLVESPPFEISYGTNKPVISMNKVNNTETILTVTGGAGSGGGGGQWYVVTPSGIKKIYGATSSTTYTAYYDGEYYFAAQHNNCYLYSDKIIVSDMPAGSLLRQNFKIDDSTIYIPFISTSESLKISPNPNSGRFSVQFMNTASVPIQIQLFNPMGKEIFTKHYEDIASVSEEINISDASSGIYMLHLFDGVRHFKHPVCIYAYK